MIPNGGSWLIRLDRQVGKREGKRHRMRERADGRAGPFGSIRAREKNSPLLPLNHEATPGSTHRGRYVARPQFLLRVPFRWNDPCDTCCLTELNDAFSLGMYGDEILWHDRKQCREDDSVSSYKCRQSRINVYTMKRCNTEKSRCEGDGSLSSLIDVILDEIPEPAEPRSSKGRNL